MINNHKLFIIAACDVKHGLGKNNDLPWRLKKEMQHFTRISSETDSPEKQNMVIMGQKTWESLPKKFRPLPNRKNVVLTFDTEYEAEGATVFNSIEDALHSVDDSIEHIFIAGGASIYKQTITLPEVDGVYLTRIHDDFDCDVFFPEIPDMFKIKQKLGDETENGTEFSFYLYRKSI